MLQPRRTVQSRDFFMSELMEGSACPRVASQWSDLQDRAVYHYWIFFFLGYVKSLAYAINTIDALEEKMITK